MWRRMNICFPLKAGSEASLKSPSRLCYRARHCPDILWLTDRPKAAALMCIFGAVYKFRRKIYLHRELISRHKLCHHKMFCEFLPLINSRNIFIKMQCHFLTPPSLIYFLHLQWRDQRVFPSNQNPEPVTVMREKVCETWGPPLGVKLQQGEFALLFWCLHR